MPNIFIPKKTYTLQYKEVQTECPSNIALIKYWGKYENQIPANPSVSYTLNLCKTKTTLQFLPAENFSVQTFLEGKEEKDFSLKIEKYFISIQKYLPWILKGNYLINTKNTFPHSSGIASSASGFGAIAKALMDLDESFSSKMDENEIQRKSSFLARLGSGSACRSIYNGLIVWGKTPEVSESSDLFAVEYPKEEIAPVFKNLTIGSFSFMKDKKQFLPPLDTI